VVLVQSKNESLSNSVKAGDIRLQEQYASMVTQEKHEEKMREKDACILALRRQLAEKAPVVFDEYVSDLKKELELNLLMLQKVGGPRRRVCGVLTAVFPGR
jgi:hypothetical protein